MAGSNRLIAVDWRSIAHQPIRLKIKVIAKYLTRGEDFRHVRKESQSGDSHYGGMLE